MLAGPVEVLALLLGTCETLTHLAVGRTPSDSGGPDVLLFLRVDLKLVYGPETEDTRACCFHMSNCSFLLLCLKADRDL